MNLKEGRIGKQEGVCLAVTAMCISGLFTLDPSFTYSNGNSTYLTLPVAAFISLLIFLLVSAAMQRCGAGNLSEMINLSFGSFGGAIVSVILLICFAFAAYLPLSRFVQAMHGLFYNGTTYGQIIAFILPTVLIMAWLGFETLGRAAKCFSGLLIIVTIISLSGASSEFEAYRLYPLLGGGFEDAARLSFSETAVFLPALTGILIVTRGLNGIKTMRKTGITSILIAALICLVVQFALGMIFSYLELEQLFMPLYRINHLDIEETNLLRMDKLAQMVWLNGCILAGSFYIYAGSSVFCRGFGVRDIRPTLFTVAVLTVVLIFMEFDGIFSKIGSFMEIVRTFGCLAIAVPLLLTALICLFKSNKKTENKG